MSDLSLRLVVEALNLFPPIIRQSLLASHDFRHTYGIKTDAEIVLGGAIAFKRSQFFDAVRRAHRAPSEAVELRTNADEVYIMTLEDREGDRSIVLRRGDQTLRLPSFWFLAADSADRLRSLDSELRSRKLGDADANVWKDRLAASPATDEEVYELTEYLKFTPQEIAQTIRMEVRAGTSQVDNLVPAEPLYYERLAGKIGDTTGLESFAGGPWKDHVARLLAGDFGAGLAQALMVSPHSLLGPSIQIEGDKTDELARVYKWLETNGDRFSQVAAVELGLSVLERFPQLEPSIVAMVKAILADDPNDEAGRLKLTASLVIFVDGDLARVGTLRGKPPFWRRLSAIAQASLIERELVQAKVDGKRFSDWAIEGRGPIFFLQNLVDLRLEPRWLPDFISPHQLKLEFLARIHGAGQRNPTALTSAEARKLLSGDDPASVKALVRSSLAYLPGPLEGGTVSPVAFPDELAAELRKPASKAPLSESDLAAVVNMALVFRIGSDHARIVADALRRTKHQLSMEASNDKIFSLLSGLATIAAVTRTPELAHEIRILARVQRRRPGVRLEADSLMRVGMIAAACETDLDRWSSIVGDWFMEIAYEDIDRSTAGLMQSHVRKLCELAPSLWRTCAKAEAAFAAVAGLAA